MTYKTLCSLFAFTLLAFLLNSCSSPQNDYESVQQLQAASAQAILSASDDSTKLKYCDTLIVALRGFINDHPKSEWNITAQKALSGWQGKRDSLFKNWQLTKDSLQEIATRVPDFQKIKDLQDAAEDVIQHSFDYAVRIKSCSDMISALQSYLSKHPSGEWSTSAQTALMSWESRKTALLQDLRSLLGKLSSLLQQHAVQEAQKRHNWSKVERMQLQSSDTTSSGGLIYVTSTYAVRMVAILMRTDIFKLQITVSGEIDPQRNQATVDSNVQVVE